MVPGFQSAKVKLNNHLSLVNCGGACVKEEIVTYPPKYFETRLKNYFEAAERIREKKLKEEEKKSKQKLKENETKRRKQLRENPRLRFQSAERT